MIAEYFKSALVVLCFLCGIICLHIQQWLGTPLYWLNRRWADSWQMVVKQSTALLVLGLTQWRSTIAAQISGDSSVKGQIRSREGKVVMDFPNRMVLVANHQLYTDWLSLWWSAYSAGYHGYLYIIIKDAMMKIPILGVGLWFFGWIFLSRRWETDKSRLEHSMSRLSDPSRKTPMWLVIFPEGTNLSRRSKGISKKWAEKNGLPNFDLTLLPRTRGLRVCLEGLANSVDWMYDCTIAYEDIPPGVDGQDFFGLRTLYIEGEKAPVTHLHWRRFAIKDMPFHDSDAFDQWLYKRWAEKEELLEHFQSYGRFPSDEGYLHTDIELHKSREALQVFTGLLAVLAAWWIAKWFYWGLIGLCVAASQIIPDTLRLVM